MTVSPNGKKRQNMRMREINRWQRNCQAHFSYDVFMQLISILRGKALSEEYLEINKKWPHKSLKFKTEILNRMGFCPNPLRGTASADRGNRYQAPMAYTWPDISGKACLPCRFFHMGLRFLFRKVSMKTMSFSRIIFVL